MESVRHSTEILGVVSIAHGVPRPSQRSFSGFVSLVLSPPAEREERHISSRVTPRYILYSILSANTIGMLCARSLHYQFYSWLAWGAPYVLWQSGLGPLWIVPLWAAQEWAWNVFPSTKISSGVVVGVLGLSTIGLLLGGRNVEEPEERRAVAARKKRS
jgi:alpha-1,3-mannosyltransferase